MKVGFNRPTDHCLSFYFSIGLAVSEQKKFENVESE